MRETVELCEQLGLANYYTCDGDLLLHTDGKQLRAAQAALKGSRHQKTMQKGTRLVPFLRGACDRFG